MRTHVGYERALTRVAVAVAVVAALGQGGTTGLPVDDDVTSPPRTRCTT